MESSPPLQRQAGRLGRLFAHVKTAPTRAPTAAVSAAASAAAAGVRDWCTPLRDAAGVRSTAEEDKTWFQANYTKFEAMVPMRDGVQLYTVSFAPKPRTEAAAGGGPLPLLIHRTTYSCAPYGADAYPYPRGFMKSYWKEGFVFVMQVQGHPTPQSTPGCLFVHRAAAAGCRCLLCSTAGCAGAQWVGGR